MKKIILTTMMSLLSVIGFSQNGKVVDETGEPLVAVTIYIPSQDLTVYTDLDGCYDIDVPEGTEIVVSYISYESKTLESKNDMLVTLNDITIKIN